MSQAVAAPAPTTGSLSTAALARLIALLLPLALLGGALGSQYLGGLYPCEMCYWQRWPHGAAILLAALAFTAPAESRRSRTLTLLAALAIAVSGAIGVYHAGVEAKIFEGFTTCTAIAHGSTTAELLKADHACAADPLRPGPVPLPRHLARRLERDPVAERRGADRSVDREARASMNGWRPGDRRADTRFHAARRSSRRIWRDADLCRAARRASRAIARKPS